ncbi:Acetyltransferase (GNAT) domain-containing protein [Geodermatophilus amargosae]|uniref:Acetyltransferase (GNAT) domain-containing protein n=1 Tax=Geodermatophilus amargosae TaxID=1296565 RepID=A0A1I6X6L9_9ACTN|nr:GNAT family N-acetyltransferase [Geodermatophilus amargosae]SFT33899.1 Acetyltransferase (GNAT) domain-containing protein [Geodermatophilus amargosae]
MSARQRLVPLSEPDEWAEALTRTPHAFAHTWASCKAMQLSTGWPTYLYTWENGSSYAVCAVAERGMPGEEDVVTPYGFGGLVGTQVDAQVLEDWTRWARERGWVCGYLGLNPLLGSPVLRESGDYAEHNDVYVLDLRQGSRDLFAALSTNRRRQVRAFDKGGVRRIGDGGQRLRTFFLDNVDAFLRERGATSTYAFTRATYEALLDSEDVTFHGVEDRDGQIVAATVLAWTPYCGEYLFGISLPEGRRWSAALLWAGALQLAERDIPYLNLGGGVRRGDGVADFKARFGGSRLPLGALRQVYRPRTYVELCRAAGVEPDDRTGFFPAYRAPDLAVPRFSGGTRRPSS